MFRGVYWQIAGMLMASTIALLALIGGSVYVQLRMQLRYDERVDLKSEIPEIKMMTKGDHLTDPDNTVKKYPLSDDRGQHIYFLVLKGSQVIALSETLPTDQKDLLVALSDGRKEHILEYNESPYLVYSTLWHYHGSTFTIHVLKSIYQQEYTLHKTLKFMLMAGGVGLIVALVVNLWLGRRVLRPAVSMYHAQQELMTELSHELQTPLATLNALSAQLERGPVRQQLQSEILHASDLVQDILYLTKLRSLPTEDTEPVAVSDITEEVAARLSILAERRDIILEGSAEQGLFVQTNPEYWKRLISTLLKNVVDHAAQPSEAWWRLQRVGRNIQFVVENQAAPDHQNTRRRPDNFEGFGLSIVHRLAENMGGNMNIRQTPEIFTVELVIPALIPPSD